MLRFTGIVESSLRISFPPQLLIFVATTVLDTLRPCETVHKKHIFSTCNSLIFGAQIFALPDPPQELGT